ncbi:putative DNA polymerase [Nitrincola phage 1M3-16]|uniref:DNA polymerase n=1 Tax=Nitrincola phage 1M3-16 TaxID=1472912 RepID=UPI000444BD8E|nr:DNA polymerase [Nitrincola phage 1M3-16]AHX01158.1 putative DNA polymerase [Nitrincola phage 1M3-16]
MGRKKPKVYKDFVWDIETYKNFFSMVVSYPVERKRWSFEISDRKDERQKMIQFLRVIAKNDGRLVGFNSIGFDYPVLHYILKNQDCTVDDIYDKAMSIIRSFKDEDKFKNTVPEKEWLIPQLDLFKVHHFDNKARSTSLKMIEFNMRMEDIQDLPYDPAIPLTFPQMDEVLFYNKHDVFATEEFYKGSINAIQFREKLSMQYKRDFTNFNDGKIGKEYFIMKLESEKPGMCYTQTKQGRKLNQTIRKQINLGECLVPYIKFKRPEFKAVHEWFKRKVITETKGSLTDIPEHELGKELAKYCAMTKKQKKLKGKPTDEELAEIKAKLPLAWVEERILKSKKKSYYLCWNIADNLNVVVDGFKYDFGTGGLHGAISNSIFETTKDRVILSYDVASYYPNLAIKNRIYPEHLSETFCDIYEDVFNQRKSFSKDQPENLMMKLALNSVYGDSNSKYSPFYDSKYTMTITISGQLSLIMLSEWLLEVPTLKMVMVNTDGCEFTVDKAYREQAERVCAEWEALTKLTLEGVEYSKMCIANVNNYIAVDVNGKIKRKGCYEYDGLGWHQNQSFLVIPMAAEHELLGRGTVEDFIFSHKERMDFIGRTKVPRSSRLVLRYHDEDGNILREEPQQNICRYYIAKEGGSLIKIMPPLPDKQDEREIGIDKEWKVKTCNHMKDYDGDLNYEYYIQAAQKLVDPLEYTE